MNKKKIGIIGTRGIPAAYGGFETFAERLSIAVVEVSDFEVLVVGEKKAVICDDKKEIFERRSISISNSRFLKSLNPLLFYIDSAIIAAKNADYIIACGPASILVQSIFNKNKKSFFINPDGFNSQRKKWGAFTRLGFRLLEFLVAKFARNIVCDNIEIKNDYASFFGRNQKVFVAEYGADIPDSELTGKQADYLDSKGLKPFEYFLVVARLVPENSLEVIVDAFHRSSMNWPLIVVGNIEANSFVAKLLSKSSKNIVFLGGLYDRQLLEGLRKFARCYIHGHTVGGTNPSLIEAMAVGRPIIAHKNKYNKSVLGNYGSYFQDIQSLKTHVLALNTCSYSCNLDMIDEVKFKYSWQAIAKKYVSIFESVEDV